jgi:hypothetical protein
VGGTIRLRGDRKLLEVANLLRWKPEKREQLLGSECSTGRLIRAVHQSCLPIGPVSQGRMVLDLDGEAVESQFALKRRKAQKHREADN